MVDEQIRSLETRMKEMEDKLDTSLQLMRKIEQGIFGDPHLNLPGVIKTQSMLQDQIDELKKEISELKKVNQDQDIAIKAKKGLTDNAVKWLTRIAIFIGILILLSLLLTGKIGLVDIVKAL